MAKSYCWSPHLVWIGRGHGTNYSAWLEHAGFNPSKANHCGLHLLCPKLFCLRFCFACRVLYVASLVRCRFHNSNGKLAGTRRPSLCKNLLARFSSGLIFNGQQPPSEMQQCQVTRLDLDNSCMVHIPEQTHLCNTAMKAIAYIYLSNGRRFPRRNATSGMVLHFFQDSCVSNPKFLIPIERQVNQQCTNTNASIVVSSGATTSKRQPPEHNLLPEHSGHVKFRAMEPTADGSNRRT